MRKIIALISIATLAATGAWAQRVSKARLGGAGSGRGAPGLVNVQGNINQINATTADTMGSAVNCALADGTPCTAGTTGCTCRTTVGSTDYTKPASAIDTVAKQKCTSAVITALETTCGSSATDRAKNCKNATYAYGKITLGDATTGANNTYCANFIEGLVSQMWNVFDVGLALDNKNCNIALARMFAAEECYAYVMTNQNEQWDALFGNGTIKSGAAERCNAEAIVNQYKRITDETITSDEAGGDLSEYFSKVGKIGVSDLVAYPGRILDAKLDGKTSAFPRELVQLVNTIKSQGNVMCGPERYSALYDTNFPLEIKTTSWQKQRDEKGIFAGSMDYLRDQIGAFTGTNASDKAKKEGFSNGFWGGLGFQTEAAQKKAKDESAGGGEQQQRAIEFDERAANLAQSRENAELFQNIKDRTAGKDYYNCKNEAWMADRANSKAFIREARLRTADGYTGDKKITDTTTPTKAEIEAAADALKAEIDRRDASLPDCSETSPAPAGGGSGGGSADFPPLPTLEYS